MNKNFIKSIFNYSLVIDLFISWVVVMSFLLSTDLINNTLSVIGFIFQSIIVASLLLLFIIELKRPSDTIFAFLILYISIGVITGTSISVIHLLIIHIYNINPIFIGFVIGACTPLWTAIIYRIYKIIRDYI